MRKMLFVTAALANLVSTQAHASQIATPWYYGWWSCSIDGRPSQMVWETRDDTQTSCNGNVCSQSQGVKVVGFFRERNSRWVRLSRVRSSDVGLAMMYNNTDPWVLNKRNPRLAVGHTTWRGGRYPLSCQKT